jgi:hypothetical protein
MEELKAFDSTLIWSSGRNNDFDLTSIYLVGSSGHEHSPSFPGFRYHELSSPSPPTGTMWTTSLIVSFKLLRRGGTRW